MAETRERIVAATVRLYREAGIAAATVPAVALAADVSPATVRNHFPGPADLATAAADAILAEVRMPDDSIFDGSDGPLERVDRLIVEVAAFYERSTGWWAIREADRVAGNAWAIPEATYESRFEGLIRAAVAPLDADPEVTAVVGAVLLHVYFGLRGAGRTSGQAVDVERRLLLPWLSTRLEAPPT
jgi:AcrR family transcriptional regulator